MSTKISYILRVVNTKQPKSVQFLLSDQFFQAVCLILVSIWLTDITLHKIGRRDRKIPISKLVAEPGKIRQTAWQIWSNMTKIRIATVCVNRGLEIWIELFARLITDMLKISYKASFETRLYFRVYIRHGWEISPSSQVLVEQNEKWNMNEWSQIHYHREKLICNGTILFLRWVICVYMKYSRRGGGGGEAN